MCDAALARSIWPVRSGLYAACLQRESGSPRGAAIRVGHNNVVSANAGIRGRETVSVETKRQARFRSVLMDEERLMPAARNVALNLAATGLAALGVGLALLKRRVRPPLRPNPADPEI